MVASFSVELRKLYRRRAVWILALTLVSLVALFGYLLSYVLIAFINGDQGEGAQQARVSFSNLYPDNVAASVLPLFNGFGTALALVFGALCMGSEYSWDTFKFSLTQRPGRLSFFAGKVLAVGVVTAIFCGLSLLVGILLSYLVALIKGGQIGWPPLWEIARAFGAGWLSLAAFASLGILLATLSRSSSLAIGLGLVYLLVIENLLSGILSQNSTTENALIILPGRSAGDLLDTFGQSLQAALMLVVFTLVCSLVSALIFRWQDLA